MTSTITSEIAAYDAMRTELERDHFGEWVVIRDGELHGTYRSFDEAATAAIEAFGRGPYLIRQAGVPDGPLPASLLYGLGHR